ncbi:MAG: hypothetical protein D6698_08950 [Gammaproteobacteria bacterium]|nr:MAG: hypothetical protein D6698_08950 [Gammaproteobacteria bacterium]
METIKGEVGFIKTRQVSTKRGMVTAYSIKLEDGPWISFGFKKPDFSKGDVVEFDVQGEYNDCKAHRIVSKDSGTGGAPAASSNRDRTIVRQNALGHATTIALALLPEKKPSSEVVAERVIKLAEKFEHWVMGDKEEE